MLSTRPLVFLDIETTGGSPAASRITEVGALRVENGKVVATYSQLINPEQPVPGFITRMTGISDDMVRDKPTFAGIADELEAFLGDAVFIAHNVNFDHSFIQAEYRRRGRSFAMDRFCTAQLSRRLYPAQRRHNLDTVIKVHNIRVANRHRALDDAAALHEFYQLAQAQHGDKLAAVVADILVVAAGASAARWRQIHLGGGLS